MGAADQSTQDDGVASSTSRFWVGLSSVTLLASLVSPACALRQNLRNQFVTYRGAWQCPRGQCQPAKMVRSDKGHREGDVHVTHVRLDGPVALVFYPGAPVERFEVTIACGARSADALPERVKGPGKHGIAGQAEAWAVFVEPEDYGFRSCRSYAVTTRSFWENGKRTYEERAGLKVTR